MNDKNYTLKELESMLIDARREATRSGLSIEKSRELALSRVLDAIGYEFIKDEEQEAFDAWANANNKLATTDQFEAWKAGREELRKNTKQEPAWILWHGGKCPLPENTKCEISSYDGKKAIREAGKWDWDHTGDGYDIVAYRIIE